MEELIFSVAIITYNQEKYISQTLDSILNQEHNYTYEIVIGEDCSTDGTRKVIEEYVKKYPNIIKPLFNEKNLGLIKNYFNVINHCIGTYIMECAGDDYWLPNKVVTEIEFMKNNPSVGMCYGKAKVWNEGTNCFFKKNFGFKCNDIKKLLKGNGISAPTVCFKNKLINEYIDKIQPLEKNWQMEDYPEWLWFASFSKISFIPELFAVYRMLPGSASHKNQIEKQFKFNKNYYEIIDYFSKLNSLKYTIKSDEEIMFFIYWNLIKSNHSNENYSQLLFYYKSLKKKSFSLFLRKVIAFFLKQISGE